MKKFLCFTVLFFTFCGHSEKDVTGLKYVNENPLWQNRTLTMQEIGKIGTDDLSDTVYMFGKIKALECDQNDNLYVLDAGLMKIKKFDSNGTWLKDVDLTLGNGPGEVQNPSQLAIGNENRLYIYDIGRHRIITVDQNGHYLYEFNPKMLVSQLKVDLQGNMYFSGFLLSYKGPIIKKYNMSYEYETEFCKRYENLNPLFEMTGNTGRIKIDGDKIFYSFEYPYEIRVFDRDGNLEERFSRKINEYKEPLIIDPTRRRVSSRARSKALYILSDGTMLHLYGYRRNDSFIFFFDLFDKDYNYLKTIELTEYAIHYVQLSCMDNQNALYLNFYEPFPQIKKFKLELK